MAQGCLFESKLSQRGLSTGLFNLKSEGIGLSPPLERGWQAGVVGAMVSEMWREISDLREQCGQGERSKLREEERETDKDREHGGYSLRSQEVQMHQTNPT